MLKGNQLQKELVEKGFAEKPKSRKKRNHKKFTCYRCGQEMSVIDDSNIMVCTNEKCNNYYLFDSN